MSSRTIRCLDKPFQISTSKSTLKILNLTGVACNNLKEEFPPRGNENKKSHKNSKSRDKPMTRQVRVSTLFNQG